MNANTKYGKSKQNRRSDMEIALVWMLQKRYDKLDGGGGCYAR
jgi:hypothetical protein